MSVQRERPFGLHAIGRLPEKMQLEAPTHSWHTSSADGSETTLDRSRDNFALQGLSSGETALCRAGAQQKPGPGQVYQERVCMCPRSSTQQISAWQEPSARKIPGVSKLAAGETACCRSLVSRTHWNHEENHSSSFMCSAPSIEQD